MNTEKQISDELLAKYMSGKATPEEETAVLDYLAESDDNLNDFQNMAAAIELQRGNEKRLENRKFWKRLTWYVSAAAAVAVLVIVGVFAFQHEKNSDEQFAQQQNAEQTSNNQSAAEVADTSHTETGKTDTGHNKVEESQIPNLFEPKHYADSSKKKNYAKMIYPASRLTSISDEKKSVNFRWSSDAVDIRLSIKSPDNTILFDKKLGPAKGHTLSLPNDIDTLNWKAEFTYSDGSISIKYGKIIRWETGIKTGN